MPRVRTTLAKSSFYYRGMQIWNSLDPTLYKAKKLSDFKSVYVTVCTIFYVCQGTVEK